MITITITKSNATACVYETVCYIRQTARKLLTSKDTLPDPNNNVSLGGFENEASVVGYKCER